MSEVHSSGHDARAETLEAWREKIDEIGEELGYFEPLGRDHAAFFSDQGTTLLVTFETEEAIRAGSETQLPQGHHVASRHGWSNLCLIARGETWYRDPAVYRYFDRLVDDAFFEDFDRVVFYGAGMGGYAAAAYSVTAPGATVVAIRPHATLNPEQAGWDPRHRTRRRLDFTSRYGYAPDMTEGAGESFVIFDPAERLDAAHAALFRRPWTRLLRCLNLGDRPEEDLQRMGVLTPLLEQACEGTLTAASFARLYRARRNDRHYLRRLVLKLEAAQRIRLEAMLCGNVAARMNAPRFQKMYEHLATLLAAQQVYRTAPPEE